MARTSKRQFTKTLGWLFILVAAVLCRGPASPRLAAAASATATPAGWDLLVKKGCARCHQVRGIGDGVVGPDLARPGPGTGFFEIAAGMWNHVPRMRLSMLEQGTEWPVLTPQELSTVVALLFTAQRNGGNGDPAAGAALFVSMGCQTCHAPGGPARPAAELTPYTSPVQMAAAMWNHGASMPQATDAGAGARLVPSAAALSDIVAHIRAAGHDARGNSVPAIFGVADRGQQVFAEKGCERCHTVQGATWAQPPRLVPPLSSTLDLAGRLWSHGRVVRTGATGGASAISRLSGQEIADIIAGLHASLVFDRYRGSVAEGRRLVWERGCLRCHSIYQRGAGTAPDLATSNVVSTQVGQVAAMWNHGRHMENTSRRADMLLPTLSAHELADITRYLSGLGSAVPARR
jgi:cytochrome c2